jgi:hypothetical protein
MVQKLLDKLKLNTVDTNLEPFHHKLTPLMIDCDLYILLQKSNTDGSVQNSTQKRQALSMKYF